MSEPTTSRVTIHPSCFLLKSSKNLIHCSRGISLVCMFYLLRKIVGSGQWAVKRSRLPTAHYPLSLFQGVTTRPERPIRESITFRAFRFRPYAGPECARSSRGIWLDRAPYVTRCPSTPGERLSVRVTP